MCKSHLSCKLSLTYLEAVLVFVLSVKKFKLFLFSWCVILFDEKETCCVRLAEVEPESLGVLLRDGFDDVQGSLA